MKSRNFIYELDHTVSKPAVKMSLLELKELQGSGYPTFEKNSSPNYVEIQEQHDIQGRMKGNITFLQTEKNCLGIGQYASVYRGTASFSLPDLPNKPSSTTSLTVAVKIGKGGVLSHVKIKLEAQILEYLQHENIIKFIHESQQEKIPILVLEYLPLGNLYEWVKGNTKQLNKELWIKWAKQITGALDCVHQYGIIHNDVKPHNIMISSGLDLKLCDFGNSCFVPEANQTLFDSCQDIDKYDENTCFKVIPPLIKINPGVPRYKDSQILHNGVARGTLAYTAPEIILNDSYSFQADIYSFGIVLYFLLSGLDPFARAKSNIYIIIGIKKGFFDSGLQECWSGKFLSGEVVCSEIIQFITSMLDLNSLNRPFAHQLIEKLNILK